MASIASEASDQAPPPGGGGAAMGAGMIPAGSGLDPNDGGDLIQSCPLPVATPPPLPSFHPHAMMHTPPPVRAERRLPARSGSAASLFAPFASLSRKLGAKHRKTSRASPNPSPNPSFMASLGRKPKNRHPAPAHQFHPPECHPPECHPRDAEFHPHPQFYPPEFHPREEIYSNTRLVHAPPPVIHWFSFRFHFQLRGGREGGRRNIPIFQSSVATSQFNLFQFIPIYSN